MLPMEVSAAWRVLEGSGGFWRVLEGSGGFWRVLEGSGGFWRVLEGYLAQLQQIIISTRLRIIGNINVTRKTNAMLNVHLSESIMVAMLN